MNFRPDSMLSEEFLKTTDSLFECVVQLSPELRRAKLERVIRSYSPPLTSYLVKCRRLSPDAADELLQSFLLEKLIEPTPEDNVAGKFLRRKKQNPEIRFRSYLRRALKNFHVDLLRKQGRLPTVDLDSAGDPGEESPVNELDELECDVAWANSLLNQACVAVRAECHLKKQPQIWEVFYERMLRPIETGMPAASYKELCDAGRFESQKQAANLYLTAIRKFNRAVKNIIGSYLPEEGNSSSAAIDAELRELQKALAAPGVLRLQQHADFSIDDSVNSLKQQLLCLSEDVASLWSDEDLAHQWNSLLAGSLTHLLVEVTGRSPDFNTSEQSSWTGTLSQLIGSQSPSLDVLTKIKDVAKRHASQSSMTFGIDTETEDVFPPSVTMLLYGLSIALARICLNERITRDRDEQFIPRVCRLLEFSWTDDQTRQVLENWLQLLQK